MNLERNQKSNREKKTEREQISRLFLKTQKNQIDLNKSFHYKTSFIDI